MSGARFRRWLRKTFRAASDPGSRQRRPTSTDRCEGPKRKGAVSGRPSYGARCLVWLPRGFWATSPTLHMAKATSRACRRRRAPSRRRRHRPIVENRSTFRIFGRRASECRDAIAVRAGESPTLRRRGSGAQRGAGCRGHKDASTGQGTRGAQGACSCGPGRPCPGCIGNARRLSLSEECAAEKIAAAATQTCNVLPGNVARRGCLQRLWHWLWPRRSSPVFVPES